MTDIKIQKIECKRCGYKWIPRKQEITLCANPKCRSPYWDKDKS